MVPSESVPLPGSHPTAKTLLSDLTLDGERDVYEVPSQVLYMFGPLIKYFEEKGNYQPTFENVLALGYWRLGAVPRIGPNRSDVFVEWLAGHGLVLNKVSTSLTDNPLLEDLYLDLSLAMTHNARNGLRALAHYLQRPPLGIINPRISDLCEFRASQLSNFFDFSPSHHVPANLRDVEQFLASGGLALRNESVITSESQLCRGEIV